MSVIPGDTYYVQISGDNGDEGEFCIEIESLNSLANDICSGAIPLSLGITCDGITPNGDNYNALDEGNGASCFNDLDKDVWYSFVAPAGGAVNIRLDLSLIHI